MTGHLHDAVVLQYYTNAKFVFGRFAEEQNLCPTGTRLRDMIYLAQKQT